MIRFSKKLLFLCIALETFLSVFADASNTSSNKFNNIKNISQLDGLENLIYPIQHLKEVPYSSLKEMPISQNVLWYEEPSKNWMTSSLPIGNGNLGAMIFGGIRQDELQFNEKTLWSGQVPINGILSEETRGAYQNFGSLFINTEGIIEATNYQRELNLEEAVATVRFTSNGINYKREYIASNPDNILAVHYTSNKKESISLNIYLEDAHGVPAIYKNGAIYVEGKLQTITYGCYICLVAKGGQVCSSPKTGLSVKKANEVILLIKAGTDYDPTSLTYTSNTGTFMKDIVIQAKHVSKKSWKDIYNVHVKDFKSYFNRVKFQLTQEPNDLPTVKLIKKYNNNMRIGIRGPLLLEQLIFNYGRYLLISSSRGIPLPANLQGIWNNSNTPRWHSDMHANINVQMNYWLSESTNLSDLHEIFLKYIYNNVVLHSQWHFNAYYSRKEITEKLYGKTAASKINLENSRGWTLFTSNDIFSGGGTFMTNNVSANAWMCMHLWQHYRFTLDQKFLLNIAYPIMKSACEFWLDRLIYDRGAKKNSTPFIIKDYFPDGTLVAPLEFSPENGPEQEDGVVYAQQLCWDLFNNTLLAMKVLNNKVAVDTEFRIELQKAFNILDQGIHIDEQGYLREWKYSEKTAGEKQHRHNSHLIGLFPGNQISPSINKDVFNAAVKSLTLRGDKGTGWSMGWKINLWARAQNGNHAHKILQNLLQLTYNTRSGNGGIYENLLDSHPPFQIDGNFGATSGISEMLLQSHTGTIHLLPALPTCWEEGYITGLCAVGNFQLDMQWKDHRLQTVTVLSKHGGPCRIKYKDFTDVKIFDKKGKPVNIKVNSHIITFKTKKREKYNLEFSTKS